ncbi:hydroxyacylglutathione hydrolase family protein [Natronospirillum operosum]|nr:hydroxyacylglutathione hydrolase family protein [Natronospirillum operosum]
MTHLVHRYFVPDSLRNYNHLVIAGSQAASIDPFNWALALQQARSMGVEITEIWLTHGHGDHIAGVPEQFDGPVRGHPDIGSRCQLTHQLEGDSRFEFNGYPVQVIATPGHTFDHVCFFLPAIPALVAGDTLFNAGVGNTRSGDTDTLYASIERLKALPAATRLYNGHDYMPTNVQFTESIVGPTEVTRRWQEACASTDEHSRPVTTLGDEQALNLFLQPESGQLKAALDLPADSSPQMVFRSLRQRRDQW